MKDKKRVLKVLLILIFVVAIIIIMVQVLGRIANAQLVKFQNTLEAGACEMASQENYSEALCDGFEALCKVRFKEIIEYELVDENIKNPLTKEFAYDNTHDYIYISWENSEMICTYKEG